MPLGVSGYVKPFVPNAPFLHPLKVSENRNRLEKRCNGNKWFKVYPPLSGDYYTYIFTIIPLLSD